MAFLRTALLLGILMAIFLAVGYFFGGIMGMTVGLVIAVGMNLAVYWFSDRIVLRMYKAKPLKDGRLNSIIHKVSENAGIPMPQTYIIENEVPNAFATGRSPSHSAVAVTKGLLDKLSEKEIAGVLGHEISHIKHRDTLIGVMAATIAGALSWMAQAAWYGSSENRNGAAYLMLFILAPISAMLVQLAISRGREYFADRSGAELTSADGLADALEKIGGYAKQHGGIRGNPSTSHMWIVNPFSGSAITSLFSTHPPIEERVRRLREMEKR